MEAVKTFDMVNFVNYDASNDLCLYEVGKQKCVKSYSFGPCVRTRCIFHYVLSGKGTLVINGKQYVINAHQGFLIPANVSAYYEADKEEPWEYYCIGKTYELFDCIVRSSTTKTEALTSKKLLYVKKIINYIQIKYSEPIHVDDIARACGFERSYLTKLFKEATGYTLQEYLQTYRMKQACKMLEQSLHPVQYIAYAVGYGDAFTFSKAFKRYAGMSPSQYQKEHQL